jgi:hypothetical protein
MAEIAGDQPGNGDEVPGPAMAARGVARGP